MQKFARRVTAVILLFICSAAFVNGETSRFTSDTFPHSLLWRVSGNGLKECSYLFGTFHSRDDRVFRLDDSVRYALVSCRIFSPELEMDSLTVPNVLSMMYLDSGKKINDYVSSAQYDSLNSFFLENMNAGITLYSRIKPFFLLMIMAEAKTRHVQFDHPPKKKQRDKFLDIWLEELAHRYRLKVIPIEQPEEQMAALDSIPLPVQISMMMKIVSPKPGLNEESAQETMIKHYMDQDINFLAHLDTLGSFTDGMMSAIITTRNHHFADRLELQMKSNSVFAAFGAGHLPGDEGVISLLRKKGYSVEPVMPRKKK